VNASRAPVPEAIDRPLFCRIVFGSKDTSVTKVDAISQEDDKHGI
jgi:hypothetical protein